MVSGRRGHNREHDLEPILRITADSSQTQSLGLRCRVKRDIAARTPDAFQAHFYLFPKT